VCHEPILIVTESSHASVPSGEPHLLISNHVSIPKSWDSWVEEMTEQAAIEYDFKPEEGWLEEQLSDSPNAEIPA
jgi:hypothetical protein